MAAIVAVVLKFLSSGFLTNILLGAITVLKGLDRIFPNVKAFKDLEADLSGIVPDGSK